MEKLLYAAGTSFLRAAGAAVLIYVTGILAAPNLDTATSLSIAALLGSLAAGLRAVQVYVPQLSFSEFLSQPWAAWLDSFARAALASLLLTLTGWLAAPDLATWRSAGLAAIVGAIAAGFRALQGLGTPGDQPQPSIGLPGPLCP